MQKNKDDLAARKPQKVSYAAIVVRAQVQPTMGNSQRLTIYKTLADGGFCFLLLSLNTALIINYFWSMT